MPDPLEVPKYVKPNAITKLGGDLLGVHVSPGQYTVRVKPSPLALTWLAPYPLGFVKPKYYGLPDDFVFGYTGDDIYHGFLGGQFAQSQRQQQNLIDELTPLANKLNALQTQQGFVPTVDLQLAAQVASTIEDIRSKSPFISARVPSVAPLLAALTIENRDRTLLATGLQAVAPLLGVDFAPLPVGLLPIGFPAPAPLLGEPHSGGPADAIALPPTGTIDQNSADNAPDVVRHLITERTDP